MTPDTYDTILYSSRGAVARISLNRPDKLNAINAAMVAELNHAMDRAESDSDVRVILLCGEGKAFSSGFDLQPSADRDGDRLEHLRRELTADFDIIMRFWDSPRVTIAAVHRWCLGSAMEMAVACDITIASEDCRFGAPEARFGSGMVALILPWIIGVKQAKELLYTGDDRIPAGRALALGLVNRVVAKGEHIDAALKMANSIAVNDEVAVSMTKQAINRSYEIMGMREALLQALELDILVEATETDESREFNRILEQHGVKAALAWREEKLTSNGKKKK